MANLIQRWQLQLQPLPFKAHFTNVSMTGVMLFLPLDRSQNQIKGLDAQLNNCDVILTCIYPTLCYFLAFEICTPWMVSGDEIRDKVTTRHAHITLKSMRYINIYLYAVTIKY